MYSVLIVDDEEPVLESYSYLIEKNLEDFVVSGLARSGSEAISSAHQSRPDIVVMDIAMPGMDGLDTIRELQHEFPDALYILSTAYERFDLAQQAIPLRVFAYLVKPVSRKKFVETMFRAKDEIDEERRRLTRRLEAAQIGAEALANETQNFMLLATWKPFDRETWDRYKRLFRLPKDEGSVLVVQMERSRLYSEIADRVQRRYRCLWTEYMQRMLLFCGDGTSPDALESYVRGVAEELADPAERVWVAAGSRHGFDALFRSYDEALNKLPPIAGSEEHLKGFRRVSREFSRATAHAHTTEDVWGLYRSLADEAFGAWDFHTAKHRIATAFELLLHELDNRLGRTGLSVSISDPVQEVAGFETRQELDAWAGRVLRKLVEQQSIHAGSQWPDVLKRAVHHIDVHYRDSMQLTDVAEHCGVSPGYLSRLLSEWLDTSFNDYLNSVRIREAENLLSEGSRTIKEIANTVGYHDPNYFSRIFRKHKGLSPTEFVKREDRHA